MGVRYSATESANLIETIATNVQTADDITERLAKGANHLIESLNAGGLQGVAYTAAQGLFSDIIIPCIQKLKEAVDDISSELDSYKTADTLVSKYGNLDLDELIELKNKREQMLALVEEQLEEHNNFLNTLKAFSTKNLGDYIETSSILLETKTNLETGISEVTEKINNLELFVSQVSNYFSDSLAVLQNAMLGASQLSQISVDASGHYDTSGIDMTWFENIKSQQIITETPHFLDLPVDEALLAQNLMTQYGFDEKTTRLILKVSHGLDEKFPDKSQKEKDYLLLRIIGSVSYGKVNGKIDQTLWDATAGSLAIYFYDNYGQKNTFNVEKSFTNIMAELGLSKQEADYLQSRLMLQHGLAGADEEVDTYSKNRLKDYIDTVITRYADKGFHITTEEIAPLVKQMYHKPDFTHQSITMASYLAPQLSKQITDLAGWEGDTTSNANEKAPSIAIDDYVADLDSVNMINRMSANRSYLQVMNSYMDELSTGQTTREAEFKQNISLKEVRDTIFNSLIPRDLSGNMILDNGHVPFSTKEAMKYLKNHHNGSYLFIKSLENEENMFPRGH